MNYLNNVNEYKSTTQYEVIAHIESKGEQLIYIRVELEDGNSAKFMVEPYTYSKPLEILDILKNKNLPDIKRLSKYITKILDRIIRLNIRIAWTIENKPI